jgi:DNA-binding transcriptional regulator YiaG
MGLGLTQGQVGTRLLTNDETVLAWEKDRMEPSVRFYPAIFRFLGYDPFPEPKTLPERLMSKRRKLGLSVKRAAKLIGVDENTFTRWERSGRNAKTHRDVVSNFLALKP